MNFNSYVSEDGTKLYIIINGEKYQYELEIPFDILSVILPNKYKLKHFIN